MNIKPKITIKEIAKETGFSINTVSNALNGASCVKPQTKEIILDAANRLGYIPNMYASQMRGGKSKTVAVIIPDISSLYFPIVVKLIESRLREHGYDTFIMNTNESNEIELDCIKSAISKTVDGVIICPSSGTQPHLELLNEYNIPFVLWGRHFEGQQYESVETDDYICGYMGTEYLLEMGHRHIIYCTTPFINSSDTQRKKGHIQALIDHGITPDEKLVGIIPKRNIVERVRSTGATAIFAFSDMLACALANELYRGGIAIPRECSLLGVDNICSHISIPLDLTSVDSEKEKTADLLISSLFELINGRTETKSHIITPKIIVRDSVLKIN